MGLPNFPRSFFYQHIFYQWIKTGLQSYFDTRYPRDGVNQMRILTNSNVYTVIFPHAIAWKHVLANYI